MCGIVGALRYGTTDTTTLQSAIYLAVKLMDITEERGKDASGLSGVFDDGWFTGQKMGLNSRAFLTRVDNSGKDFPALINKLTNYEHAPLRSIIGHCRKKSVGDAYDNKNNHPIIVNNIIGVHNGTLTNTEEIFKNIAAESKTTIKRDGTVDSEAIFRLVQFFTNNGTIPLTPAIILEVCKRLHGSFSVITTNADDPTKVAVFCDERPSELCFIKPLKLMLIASESKFFDVAVWNYTIAALSVGNPFLKPLSAKDMEVMTLPSKTACILDLSTEITAETTIKMLTANNTAIPTKDNRIWETPTTTSRNFTNTNTNNTTTFNRTNNTTPPDNKATNNKSAEVWNKTLGQYVTAEEDARYKRSASVLDAADKCILVDQVLLKYTEAEVKTEKKPDTSPITFSNYSLLGGVDAEGGKHVINSPVKIEVIEVEKNKHTPRPGSDVNATNNTANTTMSIKDIKEKISEGRSLVSDSTKAKSKAISLYNPERIKFHTSNDIVDFTSMGDVSLSHLLATKPELKMLCNTIHTKSSIQAFVDGWLAHLAESSHAQEDDTRLTGIANRYTNLKLIIGTLSSVLKEIFDKASIITKSEFEAKLAMALKKNSRVVDVLNSIQYSPTIYNTEYLQSLLALSDNKTNTITV